MATRKAGAHIGAIREAGRTAARKGTQTAGTAWHGPPTPFGGIDWGAYSGSRGSAPYQPHGYDYEQEGAAAVTPPAEAPSVAAKRPNLLTRGLSKQFLTPGTRQGMKTILAIHSDMTRVRHAGFGEAIRYALGAPPSAVNQPSSWQVGRQVQHHTHPGSRVPDDAVI
jgi:hypothetical protein